MAVTLSELLTLVGPLDDATGFETPRERYRRFITEHVTTPSDLRSFIDDCQHTLDEQQHRALLDLVVLAGRMLGFETRFGAYAPAGDTPANEVSQWRSRTGFDVLVDLRTGLAKSTDVEDLSRFVFSRQDLGLSRALGLSVTTPLFARRNALDAAVGATGAPIRVVSIRSLMTLVDMVDAQLLAHDDVVKALRSSQALDGIVDLLQRVAHRAPAGSPALPAAPPAAAQVEAPSTGFWLATVTGDPAISPEQVLERVVGKRRVFGVSGTVEGAAAIGDWIAFHVKDKGVVGRAQIAGTAREASGLRDAHQYGQILKLADVVVHPDRPQALEGEARLRLRASGVTVDTAPALRRITGEEYEALTSTPPRAIEESLQAVPPPSDTRRPEDGEIEPVTVRSPRSHA